MDYEDMEQMERAKKRRPKRLCLDCRVKVGGCGTRGTSFNIGYMLNDKLWKTIIDNENGSSKGLLCIICAQLRLGRKVKPSDFNPCPLNLREGGIISMLFPEQFAQHIKDFVNPIFDEAE